MTGNASELEEGVTELRADIRRLEPIPVILTQFCCAREAAGREASAEARCTASGEADNEAAAPRGTIRRDRPFWARAVSSASCVAMATLCGTFLALTQNGSVRMGQYDRIRLWRRVAAIWMYRASIPYSA